MPSDIVTTGHAPRQSGSPRPLPFHDLDLLIAQTVEFVDELVDLAVGGGDLGLDFMSALDLRAE